MHLWLHEPRAERVAGILSELTGSGLKAILIDDVFFEDGAKSIRHHDEWIHPLLMANTPETIERIRAIRKGGRRNPIIVYRDFRSPDRAIQALDAGADHVTVTPLRGEEIRSRIQAIQRRAHGYAEGALKVGVLTIPFSDADPSISGREIRLRRIERSILLRLALEAGKPVSRPQIYESVYGLVEDRPYINIIDRYICNIRARITASDPEAGDLIKTFPGRGYALAAPKCAKNFAVEDGVSLRKNRISS